MQIVSGLNYRAQVLQELMQSLDAVRKEVAEFVSCPQKVDGIPALSVKVRQITRTLALIELRGAALLSLELDKLLLAVADQAVRNEADATLALVRASEQLPEYLEYIGHGSGDVPLALLPLLNDMRAVRGKRLLSEAMLLLPNFSGRKVPAPGSLKKNQEEHFRDALKRARTPMVQGLLKWYRGKDVEASLGQVHAALDLLKKASASGALSRLWRIARAVAQSLIDGGLEQNAAVKSLFGQLERFLQQLAKSKNQAVYQPVPNELFRNLLYYVALSESRDKDIVRLKQAYKLDEYLPNAALRNQALHALDGPDISMLTTVAENIRDELASVKTVVEIVAHSREPDPEHLQGLPSSLKKLSATLEMLGMHQVTPVVDRLVKRIGETSRQPDQHKEALLEIASETLRIESALDEFLHSREQLLQRDFSTTQQLSGELQADDPEFEELLASLLNETLRSLEQVKENYLKALAGNRSEQQLTRAAKILEESAGALHILPMPEVAMLLGDLAKHTAQLDSDTFSQLSPSVHASYADVISHLEVYLELHIQRQPVLADLLASSADALEELKSAFEKPAEDPVPVDVIPESKPGAAEEPASPEMLGVFIEEAMQQFHAISENMALLRTDEGDQSALERVRRAYHTLKGSGRMVGATVIAEFAWSVENLMNRVLAGSVALDSTVFDLLDESVAAIPQLIDGLHGASEQVEGIDELKARAFNLADAQAAESVKKTPTLADLEAREKQSVPAANEAAAETQALSDTVQTVVETGAHTRPESDEDPVMDLTQTLDVTGAIGSSETLQLPPMDQADTVEMNGLLPADQPVVRRLEESEGADAEFTAKETAPAGFDPVLFGIFNTECAQHIGTLKDILNRALSGDGKLQASEKMVRALHTLTGSAQTARVDAIAALLSPVEIAVKRKQRAGGRFSRGETLYLSEVVTALEDRLAAFSEGRAEPDSVADVESRLESFTERVLAETDDIARAPRLGELQSVFLEEAQDLIEHLQKLMSHWKSQQRDRSFVPDLQASLHTLKGSARVASYTGIADLAHAMEDAVQRWMDTGGPFDMEVFDALDDAIGAIGINLEQAQSGEAPGYFDWLISELRNVRTDIKLETGDEETLPDAPATANVEASPEPAPKKTLEKSGDLEQRVNTRMRLDTAVIDRLTALSNEASVHHGQLGQMHNSLTESLGELDQTVARLRQQLRELDIESDIQISSAQPEASDVFDPLELDRYGRLQEISRGVLETFSDLDDIRYSLGVNLRHADVELNEQTRLNNAIQESLGQIRMVRFSSIENRLQQTVLNAGASCGKNVRLSVEGVDSAIDRSVLKHLTSPLEHLLRNAVVHGVETAEKRGTRNKSAVAQLHVQMLIDEGDIVLTVRDDGAGVDIRKVRKKALEQGLIRKNARLTGGQVLELLATPGFSTAKSLDQVAGRGVGLDAVRRDLLKIGGVLSMQTTAGEGTTFTIRIPQAQFVNQVLLLTVNEGVFAIPANRVHGVSRIRASEASRFTRDPSLRVDFNGQACRCLRLDELMGNPYREEQGFDARSTSSLVHVAVSGESIALLVNAVPGHLETIVKPAGEQISRLGGYAGACVRSDGQVVPLLDLNTLLERYLERREEAVEIQAGEETSQALAPAERLRVLVVDDSITMRKYAERALLRDNHLPVLARDGVEAMAIMKRDKPDLVLTDLEMPHMDGFELVAMIRNDVSLKDLPLIVISSRSGEKHRERLEKSGIQGFLGKPYQESELLRLIKTVGQD